MSESKALHAAVKAALAPIASEMKAVEKFLHDELSSEITRVQDIAQYIPSAGGKRMRPALLILMARALGADSRTAAYLGAVIEVLHTATLMHDDVVDEGMMRRGRPTANARWGNGQAVLVGDFLYTRSFQMMIKVGNLAVMKALTDAANRLSEGEVLQMANAHDPQVDEQRYLAVIERKTSCLFEAAAGMAAAAANASQQQAQACRSYALALGNAFQITDDVLDYEGEAAETGKNIGADLREGKVTLPVIYAREACSSQERTLIDNAIKAGNGDFAAIHKIVLKSGAIERCKNRALEEVAKGKAVLGPLPAGQFKNSLIEFLTFAVERDH